MPRRCSEQCHLHPVPAMLRQRLLLVYMHGRVADRVHMAPVAPSGMHLLHTCRGRRDRRMTDKTVDIVAQGLRRLVEEGNLQGSFAIFEDRTTGKFVQFALVGNSLICDIPLVQLSGTERARLHAIAGPAATDSPKAEAPSFQFVFGAKDTRAAAEFADRVFVEVFNIPTDADIKTTLNL